LQRLADIPAVRPSIATFTAAPCAQPDPDSKTLAEIKLEHPLWELRTPDEARQAWETMLRDNGRPLPQ
jgi:hypothetical protein